MKTFRYKYDINGGIVGRKARCLIRGDKMIANVHYDSAQTAAYAAHKASIRLIFSISASQKQPLKHFDITYAFNACEVHNGKLRLQKNGTRTTITKI